MRYNEPLHLSAPAGPGLVPGVSGLPFPGGFVSPRGSATGRLIRSRADMAVGGVHVQRHISTALVSAALARSSVSHGTCLAPTIDASFAYLPTVVGRGILLHAEQLLGLKGDVENRPANRPRHRGDPYDRADCPAQRPWLRPLALPDDAG